MWWCLAGAAVAATAKASKTDAARRPNDRKNMNEVPKSGRDRGAMIMAQAYAPTTCRFSNRFRFLQRRSRFRRGCVLCGAAVAKSQGEDGRLRDASGIACPVERPAKDGRAGAKRQGWLSAET